MTIYEGGNIYEFMWNDFQDFIGHWKLKSMIGTSRGGTIKSQMQKYEKWRMRERRAYKKGCEKMTLLDMIKKYEGVKKRLEKMQVRVAPTVDSLSSIINDVEVVDVILEDLKSIRDQQPSVAITKYKVLTKLNSALDADDYEGARNLADVFIMLPN